MTDYHRAIDIAVPADRAFAFVSDLANLPRFVPTTRSAEGQDGHVHVEGETAGGEYHDEGQFFVDPDRRLMRWGSGASAYRGELSVTDTGPDRAHVEVNLHFRDGNPHAPPARQIEQSLDQSLERLKTELTRH
jgi:hypothetical protein